MSDGLMTQPVRITDDELGVFKDVDDVVGKSVLIGDPLLAFEYGSKLLRGQAIGGLALSKLLYRLNESWDLFKAAGISDDLPTMASVHMGVAPQTAKKYLNMWESVFANENITDDVKKILMGRPIGDLLLLTAAAREGSLDDAQMLEAALAPDRNTLRDIIQDSRGARTSAGTAIRLSIIMFDHQKYTKGTLLARRGDEVRVIGYLAVDEDNELVRMAIESLLNSRHVQEIYGD